jgi:putative transcriptional regulator
MRRDGSLVRMNPDGTEEALPVGPLAPMSAAAIEAAAARDRDAPPLTEVDFARMRRVPWVKALRRARLPQEEFAAHYHIPLGTLRDWEQGRTEPDQPARVYLTVADVVFAAPADAEEDDLGRKPAALEHRHRGDIPNVRVNQVNATAPVTSIHWSTPHPTAAWNL